MAVIAEHVLLPHTVPPQGAALRLAVQAARSTPHSWDARPKVLTVDRLK